MSSNTNIKHIVKTLQKEKEMLLRVLSEHHKDHQCHLRTEKTHNQCCRQQQDRSEVFQLPSTSRLEPGRAESLETMVTVVNSRKCSSNQQTAADTISSRVEEPLSHSVISALTRRREPANKLHPTVGLIPTVIDMIEDD